MAAYKFLKNRAINGGYKIAYEEETIPYILERDYVPDFILEFASGHKRYIEAKGYLRPDDIKKMIAVRRQHPDLDIRIYFAKNNKVSSKSKMRYSDWSERYGFIYSIGSIPEEWLVE